MCTVSHSQARNCYLREAVCLAMMDMVSLLTMDSELELTLSLDAGQITHLPSRKTFFVEI